VPDIAEYTLANGTSDTDLIANVNRLIKKHWRPIGGPLSVQNQDGETLLIQAMVRPAHVGGLKIPS
jgi:hypothetical protein